ncbi:MAG: DUF4870 domain-containing protein [Spirochaetota bacterium]|nr:MAG: DUF4870 domain-containing protein [Spirochaetota bacterium]
MDLTPEERRRIYEEEKARIEAEQKQSTDTGSTATGLEPNIAGLLCYLGGWVTGIVFLILEKKNKFVRFHALQSIVTFGVLTVVSALLGWIPVVGGYFSAAIGILAFILWIILMVKAYQGDLYKIPVAGRVAEGILPHTWRGKEPETGEKKKSAEPKDAPPQAISKKMEEFGKRVEGYFEHTRSGRIAGYSASIFWNIALIIFFSFFHQYIAWYHVEPDGGITRLSMLTNDYFAWLPFLITALVISVATYILLIIYDKDWLRKIIQIILNVIGIVVVVKLASIFPFDFSVIPYAIAVDIVPVVVTIVLIVIAVGLGIGALVRFIRLITDTTKKSMN